MSELISIIVPIYNIKEYLERCVDSILAQTYENIEVLLVDDGSTDGTSLLVDELRKKDSRIRVFHKENRGSSSARNLGLQHAVGSYVWFVDPDDFIRPDCMKKIKPYLKENERNIFYLDAKTVPEEAKWNEANIKQEIS